MNFTKYYIGSSRRKERHSVTNVVSLSDEDVNSVCKLILNCAVNVPV